MNVEKMDGAVRNNSTEHFPSNALKYLQNVSCKTEVLSVVSNRKYFAQNQIISRHQFVDGKLPFLECKLIAQSTTKYSTNSRQVPMTSPMMT